jgi:hypothetical protein
MRTLVTHNQPHLDDLCAMWIMARYLPGWQDATFAFIPANTDPSTVQDTEDRVHVGVGRGRFDEHKGDHGECATTLVAKHVLATAEIPEAELRALDKMVAWALEEDLGRLLSEPRREFSIPAALQLAYFSEDRDSERVRALAFGLLDAIMVGLRNHVQIETDWKDRIEFDSRFGRAIAIRTDAQEFSPYAYAKGFDVVVLTGKETPYATIRARATAEADLAPVRDRIAAMEDVPWFFHHSGKMLICGGQKTDGSCRTTLSLEQLIELVK